MLNEFKKSEKNYTLRRGDTIEFFDPLHIVDLITKIMLYGVDHVQNKYLTLLQEKGDKTTEPKIHSITSENNIFHIEIYLIIERGEYVYHTSVDVDLPSQDIYLYASVNEKYILFETSMEIENNTIRKINEDRVMNCKQTIDIVTAMLQDYFTVMDQIKKENKNEYGRMRYPVPDTKLQEADEVKFFTPYELRDLMQKIRYLNLQYLQHIHNRKMDIIHPGSNGKWNCSINLIQRFKLILNLEDRRLIIEVDDDDINLHYCYTDCSKEYDDILTARIYRGKIYNIKADYDPNFTSFVESSIVLIYSWIADIMHDVKGIIREL